LQCPRSRPHNPVVVAIYPPIALLCSVSRVLQQVTCISTRFGSSAAAGPLLTDARFRFPLGYYSSRSPVRARLCREAS
jgi:hypothetical protein